MSDEILDEEVVDNYLEHAIHNYYDAQCSSCYSDKLIREANEVEVECVHDFEEGVCQVCGDVAQVEGWTDLPDYGEDGNPSE